MRVNGSRLFFFDFVIYPQYSLVYDGCPVICLNLGALLLIEYTIVCYPENRYFNSGVSFPEEEEMVTAWFLSRTRQDSTFPAVLAWFLVSCVSFVGVFISVLRVIARQWDTVSLTAGIVNLLTLVAAPLFFSILIGDAIRARAGIANTQSSYLFFAYLIILTLTIPVLPISGTLPDFFGNIAAVEAASSVLLRNGVCGLFMNISWQLLRQKA